MDSLKLKQVLTKATEEDLKKLIDAHPFNSEAELTIQLIGAATIDMSPAEFAKATGISNIASIHIFSMLVSHIMVPSIRRRNDPAN